MKDSGKILDLRLEVTTAGRAIDLLAAASGLSRGRLKEAMRQGAVWLQPGRGKGRRLRRSTAELKPGDLLRICYDEGILAAAVAMPVCLEDRRSFSVWFKPAGLLSQGTAYGDFASLLRQAELHFRPQRQVYLVHRLDREVSGLMLVSHDRRTAAWLSRSFAERRVAKSYLAEVWGRIAPGESLTLDADLEHKPARTLVRGLVYDPVAGRSLVLAQPETGRLHQIRRHLAGQGTPIVGDPRYGSAAGKAMRLCAVRLLLPPDGKTSGFDFRLPHQYLPEWAAAAGSVWLPGDHQVSCF